jgi:N-acetylmuramoyl-L-alanine amidase
MKMKPLLRSATLAALGLGVSSIPDPAIAASFSNTEIDQNRIVAIASPYGKNLHQLLIVEQIKDSRPCWQEAGSSPTVIEPTLTKFDFTGICNRSTDSNGYSVRVGGQDMGWRYSLRIVKRDGDMKLVAVPTASRNAPELEIGTANGLTDGFAKIQLNSGWRMTKRVYNGQKLGHIYLTNDQSLDTLMASAPTRPTAPTPVVQPPVSQPQPSTGTTRPPLFPKPGSTVTQPPVTGKPIVPPPASNAPREIEFSVDPNATDPGLPPVVVSPTPPTRPTTGSNSVNLAESLGFNYRVIVPSADLTTQAKVRRLVPGAFRTTVNGQTVMQVGVFKDRATADQLQQRLSQQNLQATIVPVSSGGVSQNSQPSVVGI